MAFTGTVLDNFNTGALQNLTSRTGWGGSVFWTGDVTLVTDAVPTKTSSPGAWSSNWWVGTFTDSECGVTLPAGIPSFIYLHTRASGAGTAAPSGYRLEWGAGAGNWTLKVMTGGALGGAILSGTQAPAAGDSIGLSSTSTTHEVWYKAGAGAWVSQGSVVDTSYASGVIAVEISPTGPELDAFLGGSTGGGIGGGGGHEMTLLGVGG